MATITVKGSTFPSTPSTDQIFYKTDAFSGGSGAWCSIVTDTDTTNYWATSLEYQVTFPEVTQTTTDAASMVWIGDDFPIFVGAKSQELRTFVDTTNDSDNCWTITYYAVQTDGTTGAFAQRSTENDSPDTYYNPTVTASTFLLTNYGGFYIDINKVGSPGALTYAATVNYKLVIST